MTIRLNRAYDNPARADGKRVLVERLWPRGVTRARAAVDLWLKEIAPSAELRKWFAHDPAKWTEFKRRYRRELRDNPVPVKLLRRMVKQGTVTLIYAARDDERNSAVLLRKFLERG